MAKEKAKTKEKAAAPAEEFKYGVKDLADMLSIEAASVRIKLRNAGVKKASNGAYGWNTKDELKAVADQLNAKKAPAKADTKSAGKDEAKASTKKGAPAKEPKKAANDKGAKKSGKKAA